MRALSELPTPCLLLDQSKLDRNLARMAERMRSLKVDLKPHLKTAKSAEIAARATAGFSGGITVSTLAADSLESTCHLRIESVERFSGELGKVKAELESASAGGGICTASTM